jgi:hypothetical protein
LRAFYLLVADIRDAAGFQRGKPPHPGRATALLIGGGVLGRVLPDWWALLGVPVLIAALWPAQNAINARCDMLDPAAGRRFRRVGPTAIAGIVFGCALWGLFALGVAGPGAVDTLFGRTSVADGTISFGHSVDSSGRTLSGQTNHFRHGDHIAWIASFAQPLTTSDLTLAIDEAKGPRSWSSVDRLKESITSAVGASYLYDPGIGLPELSASWPHSTGRYRMSYWAKGQTVAQGTFDVAP